MWLDVQGRETGKPETSSRPLDLNHGFPENDVGRSGSTMFASTVTMEKINRKKLPGEETLGDFSGFSKIFRVVSRDDKANPE